MSQHRPTPATRPSQPSKRRNDDDRGFRDKLAPRLLLDFLLKSEGQLYRRFVTVAFLTKRAQGTHKALLDRAQLALVEAHNLDAIDMLVVQVGQLPQHGKQFDNDPLADGLDTGFHLDN